MRPLVTTLFVTWFATLGATHAAAQSSCPEASPWDWQPDAVLLQACLERDQHLYLERGNPGYIIDNTIYIGWGGYRITSVNDDKAVLIGAEGLIGPLIKTGFHTGWEVSNLVVVDGRKWLRTVRYLGGALGCAATGHNGMNLWLQGRNFLVHHVDSINAACGSGMGVQGDDFEVRNSYLVNNGAPQEDGGPWADGMTVWYCNGAYIHDNYLENNTDVDVSAEGLAVR
jgi:hypothetical protein